MAFVITSFCKRDLRLFDQKHSMLHSYYKSGSGFWLQKNANVYHVIVSFEIWKRLYIEKNRVVNDDSAEKLINCKANPTALVGGLLSLDRNPLHLTIFSSF